LQKYTHKYLEETVVDAARRRVAFVFDHFETIHVSISGGKDSSVLAHLAILEAQKRGRKVGLFFLDEEAMYQSTIEMVEYWMAFAPESINRLWMQIPFSLTSATSYQDSQLLCWEPGKRKEWMRQKSENNIRQKPWAEADEKLTSGYKWLDFYGAITNYERCYKGAAFLLGERAQESPNRRYSVTKHPVTIGGQKIFWGTPRGDNFTLKPIYDWQFSDVWKYHHDNGIKHSRIYDYQFLKGYNINEVRISSLIHERSFKSLCDLPEFEPKTFEKLCKRIKGVSFVQETGKAAKLFRASKLPKNFTSWIAYRDFLLETYPLPDRRPIFEKRFSKHLSNEYVARQQCRQLICNDYENNLPIDNKPDPRQELIRYYEEQL
jgi:predicted phosphoadenosine phosphosulfate sulfurtransferase